MPSLMKLPVHHCFKLAWRGTWLIQTLQHPPCCSTTTFLRFGKSFKIVLNRNSPLLMLYHYHQHSVLTSSGYLLCEFKFIHSLKVGFGFVHYMGTVLICEYFVFLPDLNIVRNSMRAHVPICPQQQLIDQQSGRIKCLLKRVSCLRSDLQYKPWGLRLHPPLTGQLAPSFRIKLHCHGRCS